MAKCTLCKQEMLTANGCRISTVMINGRKRKRIKMGDPGDFFEDSPPGTRCGDCGAIVGNYHHWGCDCERCPECGEQLIGCDCENVYAEFGPPRHGRRFN